MVLATAGVDRVLTSARFNASSLFCVVFVAAIAGLTSASRDLVIAVYALGFWHYYLYGLAYRFGAVAIEVFKRDAILMKSVSLGLCGWAYFSGHVDVVSICVIAVGFFLNAVAARELGADRTYYGYELADLPFQKVTRFPYSWIAHPMLVGNVAAFGGMLLNGDFRRQWWPLACVHVALNVGLLLMELYVVPLRLGRRPAERNQARKGRNGRGKQDGFALVGCAAATAGFGSWVSSRTNGLLGASIAASLLAYTYGIYRCYSDPQLGAATDHRPEKIG
ncbi:MAG TPA: methyltransferase [Pirellulales bacterium]|nr:methyltransferase [Pirellulales bacterium]